MTYIARIIHKKLNNEYDTYYIKTKLLFEFPGIGDTLILEGWKGEQSIEGTVVCLIKERTFKFQKNYNNWIIDFVSDNVQFYLSK